MRKYRWGILTTEYLQEYDWRNTDKGNTNEGFGFGNTSPFTAALFEAISLTRLETSSEGDRPPFSTWGILFCKWDKYIWQFGQIYWPPLWEIVAAPTAYRSYSTPLAWTAEPPGGVTSFLQDLWNFQGCRRLWWKSFWQYVCLLDSESWQKCRNMSCWEVVLHNYLCRTISKKTKTSGDVSSVTKVVFDTVAHFVALGRIKNQNEQWMPNDLSS